MNVANRGETCVKHRRERKREPEFAPASPELDAFVEDYFARHRAVSNDLGQERMSIEPLDLEGRVFRFEAAVISGSEADLEAAWPMLLALIQRAPDDEALAYVAAGPLEDFVLKRHDRFGARMMEEARRNERFRLALRGVWGWQDLPQPFRNRLISLAGFPIEADSSPVPVRARAKRKRSPR
jgi:hypothetical protein